MSTPGGGGGRCIDRRRAGGIAGITPVGRDGADQAEGKEAGGLGELHLDERYDGAELESGEVLTCVPEQLTRVRIYVP